MSEIREDEIDRALGSAFGNVHASDELKDATMARIAALRAQQDVEGDEAPKERRPSDKRAPRGKLVQMGSRRGSRRRVLAIAASVALCLVIATSGVGIAYQTETAYAEVQTEYATSPIVLSVNRFDRVLSARSNQAEVQSEIDSLGLVHMSYDDAIETLAASGYLGEQSVDVQISSNDANQQQKMAGETTERLASTGHFGSCNGQGFGKHDGSASPAAPSDGTGYGSGAGGNAAGGGNGHGSGQGAHHGSGHHDE